MGATTAAAATAAPTPLRVPSGSHTNPYAAGAPPGGPTAPQPGDPEDPATSPDIDTVQDGPQSGPDTPGAAEDPATGPDNDTRNRTGDDPPTSPTIHERSNAPPGASGRPGPHPPSGVPASSRHLATLPPRRPTALALRGTGPDRGVHLPRQNSEELQHHAGQPLMHTDADNTAIDGSPSVGFTSSVTTRLRARRHGDENPEWPVFAAAGRDGASNV
jgi:hypothetical protein